MSHPKRHRAPLSVTFGKFYNTVYQTLTHVTSLCSHPYYIHTLTVQGLPLNLLNSGKDMQHAYLVNYISLNSRKSNKHNCIADLSTQ